MLAERSTIGCCTASGEQVRSSQVTVGEEGILQTVLSRRGTASYKEVHFGNSTSSTLRKGTILFCPVIESTYDVGGYGGNNRGTTGTSRRQEGRETYHGEGRGSTA